MEEENSHSSEGSEDKETSEPRIENNPDKKLNMDKITQGVKKNPWMVASVVLGIVCIVLLVMVFNGGVTGQVISQDEAGENVIEFLNAQTGGGVEYIGAEDIGNLYEITVEYQGNNIPVFVTKDGEYFVQGAVPLTTDVAANPSNSQNSQPTEVPKSDKPVVELFVMTHCPYGTQAEKGILSAYEALGNKIDSSIKFVHYMMHEPEETETPIQVCIREEQSSKFNDYLTCFLGEGDSDACLTEVGVDKTKLDKCVADKSEEYYASDSELSEGYGVQGSPTLVVNGVVVSSARDSASYLDTICSAFNEAPEECGESLSSASPSPGFGYIESSGASADAQCG